MSWKPERKSWTVNLTTCRRFLDFQKHGEGYQKSTLMSGKTVGDSYLKSPNSGFLYQSLLSSQVFVYFLFSLTTVMLCDSHSTILFPAPVHCRR